MRAGIDEAGRGPLLGPLVVAGVAVEDETALRDLGVRDSKKLAPKRREELAAQIQKVAARHAVLVLSANEIDEGRDEETLNLIEARAFAVVGRRLGADEYVLDAADVSEDRFRRLFLKHLDRRPAPAVISVHKADALHPVVSAASILAKVERDRHVAALAERLERIVGMPMGSGYPADPLTVAFLEAYVEKTGGLPPEVRASWRPVQLLMARRRLRPLSDF